MKVQLDYWFPSGAKTLRGQLQRHFHESEDYKGVVKEVIASSVSIEHALESVISLHLFGASSNLQGAFFKEQILGQNMITLSNKERIVSSILDDLDLSAEQRREFRRLLKVTRNYRNNFAHGYPTISEGKIELNGTILDDDYLRDLEINFLHCHQLISKVMTAALDSALKRDSEYQEWRERNTD